MAREISPAEDAAIRSAKLKVFVSSQIVGMGPIRETVRRAIEQSPHHRAWLWERDAAAGPFSAIRICLAEARTSDLLFLILGAELTAVTRKEYQAARRRGVSCHIFLQSNVVRTLQLERFIERERAHSVTNDFTSVSDLRERVRLALLVATTRDVREMAFRRAAYVSQAESTNPRLSPVHDSRPRLPSEIIAAAMTLVGKGRRDEAVDLVGQHAAELRASGRPDLANSLMRTFLREAPARQTTAYSWLMCEVGLAFTDLNQSRRAILAYERMLRLAPGDDAVSAVAQLNLGAQAMRAEDESAALRHFRMSADSAIACGDSFTAIQVFLNLAQLRIDRGESAEAQRLLTFSSRISGLLRSNHLRASTEGLFGNLLVSQGNLRAAEAAYRRAIRYVRREDDPIHEMSCLHNLGSCLADQERYREAVAAYAAAFRLGEQAAPAHLLLPLMQAIGVVHARLDQFDIALAAFDRATQLANELDDGELALRLRVDAEACRLQVGGKDAAESEGWLAATLVRLAAEQDSFWTANVASNLVTFAARRASKEGVASYVATAIGAGLDEPDQTRLLIHALAASASIATSATVADWARTLCTVPAEFLPPLELAQVGVGLTDAGHPEVAINVLSVALRRSRSDTLLRLDIRNSRGIAYIRAGQLERAVSDFRLARAGAQHSRYRVTEQHASTNLAEALRRCGRIALALTEADKSVRLARRLRAPEDIAGALGNLALVQEDAGNFAGARGSFEEVLAIATLNRDRENMAFAIRGFAGLDRREGRLQAAMRQYERAASLSRQAGDFQHEIECMGNVLLCLSELGEADTKRLQAFVDRSQALRAELFASDIFRDCAMALLEANNEGGIEMASNAILMTIVGDTTRPNFVDDLARTGVEVAVMFLRTLPARDARRGFFVACDQVIERLPRGVRSFMRSHLQGVWTTVMDAEQERTLAASGGMS